MILHDGTQTTAEQVKTAFLDGLAVLVHGRADGGTATGLMLDGRHIDTRGECYSMWEEVWTTTPSSIKDCLKAGSISF